MANWPETTRLIGTRIPRLDGLAKASGRAKYPSDVRPEGLLFGVILWSPHAHAKIKSIDVVGCREDAGCQGDFRRESQCGRDHFATKVNLSRPSPPRRKSRPATRSAPSRSNTRYCPTSSPKPKRWRPALRQLPGEAISERAAPLPRACPTRPRRKSLHA